ncbi:MAG TPA: MFS transporter [Hyphomicrobiaceae bacterium]|nr:MFS transporter [Hyphomicrobiaceae bacterium]
MPFAADAAFTTRVNVALLALCQALSMSMQSMGIATTPLAGHALLGTDKSLATLPLVLVHLGVMATTIPASLLMARIGRRGGFSIGALAGIAAGVVSTAAIFQNSFLLLCVGALIQGSAAAFAWYFRFAAADAADAAFRAKAISLVLAGGVIAGFAGPELSKWTKELFAPVSFAGIYAMFVVLSAIMLALLQGLRIPRLTESERKEGGRPMSEIVRQPAYMIAVISSMLGYGVMTLVMSATPLAMLDCGFTFNDSATVIQAHVVAMFLPSFFTGHLIARFGVLNVIAVGAVIQLACALVNLTGIEFAHFFVANILVGLGWNFMFIGGSTLLTTTYRPAERAKAQASHDFLVYATTALAAGLSGLLQANVGWTVVNAAAIPATAVVITAVAWLASHQRQPAAGAG